MAGFTITIAGDSALNLEFAHAISAETSAKIRMAADNLTADPIRGITELVPTFCSLMVYYNPLVITFDELSTKLRSKLRDVGEADLSIRKIVPIPVCYGGEFGPDLANVAQLAGLSEDEVIAIHAPGRAAHAHRAGQRRNRRRADGHLPAGLPRRLADHRAHAAQTLRSRS